MKKFFLQQLIHKAAVDKRLRKKLAIFGGVFAVVFVLFSALVVWLGVKMVSYAVNMGQEMAFAPQVESVQQVVRGDKALLPPGCLSRAQGLLNPVLWLERPVAENLRQLQAACVDGERNNKTELPPEGGII